MRGCASTPAPQCWNELAGPTTTRGQRPSRRNLSCWVGGCLRRSRRVFEASSARHKSSSELACENVALGSKLDHFQAAPNVRYPARGGPSPHVRLVLRLCENADYARMRRRITS